MARGVFAVAACLVLANCASSGKFASQIDPKYGVSSSPRVVEFGEPVPKGGGTYRVGKPYTVAGRVYVPEEEQLASRRHAAIAAAPRAAGPTESDFRIPIRPNYHSRRPSACFEGAERPKIPGAAHIRTKLSAYRMVNAAEMG